jgi:hypothetical protein
MLSLLVFWSAMCAFLMTIELDDNSVEVKLVCVFVWDIAVICA